MTASLKRIHLLVGILVVLGLALVAGSGVVFAKGLEAPQRQGIECEANTQQPHNSTHRPGRINVVGTVECTGAVQELEVWVTLQEEDCIWLFCWWDDVGPTGHDDGTGVRRVQANSSIACVPGHYRGYSEERIVWPNGQEETGWGYSGERSLSC